jgi:hypothetical protein
VGEEGGEQDNAGMATACMRRCLACTAALPASCSQAHCALQPGAQGQLLRHRRSQPPAHSALQRNLPTPPCCQGSVGRPPSTRNQQCNTRHRCRLCVQGLCNTPHLYLVAKLAKPSRGGMVRAPGAPLLPRARRPPHALLLRARWHPAGAQGRPAALKE